MTKSFVILIFILLISCERENNTEVKISGIVLDAFTNSPVEGATVRLCIRYSCEGRTYTNNIGISCQSDQDGKYTLNHKYNNNDPPVFADMCTVARQSRSYPFPGLYAVYASRSDYITTDYHSLNDNYLEDADIKLYHGSQLNIHARNDGLNNVRDVRVCVDRGPGFTFFGTPQFVFRCLGYDFDSVFVIKNLWGGFSYTCKVIPLNGTTYNPLPYVDKSIYLTPDTINHIIITY